MKNRIALRVALAVALGAAAVGSAHAQMYGYGMMGPGHGPGMMYGQGYGPGMMYGNGYGPGMMGSGAGPGMMYGPGWYRNNQANLNISTDDAKKYFERMIAIHGNSRLKVGDVKEKDADTLTVDIVTKDNSLVQRFLLNRHNGAYQPEEG